MLTGETPSQLHSWFCAQPSLPLSPKTRSEFSRKWTKSAPDTLSESTCDCSLGSRPLNCRIRVRAISFQTPIDTDGIKPGRRYLLLMAYEVCTSFIYYELFSDDNAGDEVAIGLRSHHFIDFYLGVVVRVGLPIPKLILTNHFLFDKDGKPLSNSEAQQLLLAKLDDGQNPRPSVVALDEVLDCYPPSLFEHPVPSNVLLAKLDQFVNTHNAEFGIPQIKKGRRALKDLAKNSVRESPIPVLRPKTKDERRLKLKNVANAVPLAKLALQSSLKTWVL